ncbi:hypothetical protein GDO78_015496 [Eleutherodactylus coqui]|uniref:Ig-like domain-containing protein n=1 Tax=Eleutherodactylus coqui TaxID=57060 RepID=A0A8J6E8J2_ELECQ|nr:hypothetical protein GDO78_015496 [Eleutherodactylus coqui]
MVIVSCNASGYDFTNYRIDWLRQIPRNQPVYKGYINPGSRGKSFEGRFNMWTNSSISMAYLDISGVQLEDAAVYYCARDPQ